MANPVLPTEVLEEAVPGNIRKAEHFVAFLRRLVEYLKTRLSISHVESQSPAAFLDDIQTKVMIGKKPLRFCSERLASLVQTLELVKVDEFSSLKLVADFAALIGTYEQGFSQ